MTRYESKILLKRKISRLYSAVQGVGGGGGFRSRDCVSVSLVNLCMEDFCKSAKCHT